MIRVLSCFGLLALIAGCLNSQAINGPSNLDYLIINGAVYDGSSTGPKKVNVGICGNEICYIGDETPASLNIINAEGLIVTPGFIDPHTHSLEELYSKDKNSNLNYLMQGVTTVINGNDGGGHYQINKIAEELTKNGIGTNVALLVGHGTVRKAVMGKAERTPTKKELEEMKSLVEQAMQQGALGFSSGLYYVPGVFSDTEEVIELAKIAAKYNGIYDTHLRDESTFNIGFLEAVKEAVNIAKEANIHLHIAHIKALGVDVWGQSQQAVDIIELAQKSGVSISADQYPWQASGTYLDSAVIPSWVRADSDTQFKKRLMTDSLRPQIKAEIKENLRRRGGGNTLLITESDNNSWLGKTIAELANEAGVTEEDAVIHIALIEKVRVASFNMNADDIKNFMVQDWVVTSSDGTNGHPRKYASFPMKYQKYVKDYSLLSLNEFLHKSSGKTADYLGIKKRGYIKLGFMADINLIELAAYKANADFFNWNTLSTGISHQFVNGQHVINNYKYNQELAGEVILK